MPKRLPALFASPEASTGFLLWQAANLWQRRQREALAPLGLSHVQFVLLTAVTWLAKEDATPITQVRLARHARIDAMMTSQVVRALHRKKLVRRSPHPADSRAMVLLPSAAGRKLTRQAIYLVERADQDFFATLGGDAPRLTSMLRTVLEPA